MAYYLFLSRGFHNDRIIERNECAHLPDDTVPGPHMIEVPWPPGDEPSAAEIEARERFGVHTEGAHVHTVDIFRRAGVLDDRSLHWVDDQHDAESPALPPRETTAKAE